MRRDASHSLAGEHAVLMPLTRVALARFGGEPGLRGILRRIAAEGHPNWLRWLGFDTVAGYLTREWVNGFTLAEMVQRRSELRPREVVELCGCLPEALIAIENAGLAIPYPLLGEVFVSFGQGIDHAAIVDRAVTDWPVFALKVNPLRLTEPRDREQTRVPDEGADTLAFADNASPKELLAELIYDLLRGGGPSQIGGAWSPLEALNESANSVLREGLLGIGDTDAVEFWRAFVLAVGGCPALPPRVEKIRNVRAGVTVKAHGLVRHATLLRLRPANKAMLPLHVSARPCLRIGRGSNIADMLTRFLPETAANLRLTNRLGRVHVLGRRVDGWPCFVDGDGRRPSVNGSWLDEQSLDPESGMRCAHESCLRLGRHYRLRVTCLDEAPVELESGCDKPESEIEREGCTVIFAQISQPTTRLVAWLGGSVGLEVGEQGLTWSNLGAARSEAALLHAQGGFWLANLKLPGNAIRIDGTALAIGSAVPLCDRQEIQTGTACYEVRIDE